MDNFLRLVSALHEGGARFAVIGVWGANYYARSGATLFTTLDRDSFLPLDPGNLLEVWRSCESVGLALRAGDRPLDSPRDRLIAERVIERKALTSATDDKGIQVDLALLMTGFEFEEVWIERRTFIVEGIEIPVARLRHIVASKKKAGRPKDNSFWKHMPKR